MGKTLRLGFALGGGVSLGSFCGAALSEVIKLAVLYGKDRNGQKYERVEVDVGARDQVEVQPQRFAPGREDG